MATHSSILACRISQTEKPGGLESMELKRVRHNSETNTLISKKNLSKNKFFVISTHTNNILAGIAKLLYEI